MLHFMVFSQKVATLTEHAVKKIPKSSCGTAYLAKCYKMLHFTCFSQKVATLTEHAAKKIPKGSCGTAYLAKCYIMLHVQNVCSEPATFWDFFVCMFNEGSYFLDILFVHTSLQSANSL